MNSTWQQTLQPDQQVVKVLSAQKSLNNVCGVWILFRSKFVQHVAGFIIKIEASAMLFKTSFKRTLSLTINIIIYKKWLQNKTNFNACQSLIENSVDSASGDVWLMITSTSWSISWQSFNFTTICFFKG